MYANHTTVAEVVQHLPQIEQQRVFRLIERRAERNPRFRDRLCAAKAKAEQEERARGEWLCQMAADRDAYHTIDVPF